MKVTVLGSGGWGTALALLLLENGHQVSLWSYTQEEHDAIAAARENPVLPGVPLPPELELTTDMGRAADSNMVVLATPSFAVRTTARSLNPIVTPGTVLVNVAKGMERDTGLRLSQVIRQETEETCPVAVLCGPTHAEEVGRGIPSAIVAASENQQAAMLVQDAFMNGRFRVYTNSDVVGAELGAALKNIIALCAGISDGLGYGDNTRAMLMTRGLTEIARLGVAMGARQSTFAGLTGLGDLIVTCTSVHSRNHQAGLLIGQGIPVAEVPQHMGKNMVVEGYYATASAWEQARRLGLEMPITEMAYAVLYEGQDVRKATGQLMGRQRRHEVEDAWVV